MKLKNISLVATISLALLFTGCGNTKNVNAGKDNENEEVNDKNVSAAKESKVSASDLFSDRDFETGYDESSAAKINLNGKSAECDSNAVKIDDNKITIKDEGTYIISGTLEDGMVIVDADESDKVQIVLNGAEISNSTSAALYVLKADKVFVTTAVKSENVISNGGTYNAIDENNIDAVIYSKEDLTFNGEGSLTIKAEAGHGIVSKDSLVFTSGEYDITAKNHGLSGKDDVSIADGSYKIVAGKDGIHAENSDDESLGFAYILNGTFDITAEGDGISGAAFGQIEDGNFKIKSGGGYENVSVKTDKDMNMHGMPDGHGRAPDMRGGHSPRQWGDRENITGEDKYKSNEDGESESKAVVNMSYVEINNDNKTNNENVSDNKVNDENVSDDTVNETTSMKGIKTDGDLYVNGGEFEIDSADDSLHSNSNIVITGGNFKLASGDDGIHADFDTAISNGTINISQSYEGIEGKTINITGGDISLVASDDGLNAAGGADSSGYGGRFDKAPDNETSDSNETLNDDIYINITGGNINIKASGDGVDSNGDLTVSGGQIYVSGPSDNGNGALDYNGEAIISGGVFVATGSLGMAQNFGSSSTQGAMLVSTEGGTSGDEISLVDSDGNELVSWKAEKDYACVNISCPEIVKGETYTLTTGDTINEITMNNLIYGEGNEHGGRRR